MTAATTDSHLDNVDFDDLADKVLGGGAVTAAEAVAVLQADAVDDPFQQRVRSVHALVVRLVAGYLENGLNRGFLRQDLDTDSTAEALVGVMLSGAMLEAFGTGTDRDRFAAAGISLMFEGIARADPD